MNYYPFHIGDYIAHTTHLSWEEDIAYRRMLDAYYLLERALPADKSKIARLIRMPDSIGAIESVLDEFFELADDGWHNQRADSELSEMATKQQQQEEKSQHESERMRRHRARRSQMFADLRSVNVVPAYDVSIQDLQRLHDKYCNGTATDLQRERNANATDLQRERNANCNGPETAIPTPTPIPINISPCSPPVGDGNDSADSKRRRRLPEDFTLTDPRRQAAVRYWAGRNRADLDPDHEFGKFIANHRSKGSRMLDWDAAWQTWYSNAVTFNRPTLAAVQPEPRAWR